MKNKHYTLTAIAILISIIAVIFMSSKKEVIYVITQGSCIEQVQKCNLEQVNDSEVYFCTCEDSGNE